MSEPGARTISYRRFVLEEEIDEDLEQRFETDLAVDDRTLRKAHRRFDNEELRSARQEARSYATREAAERALEKSVASLLRKGYVEDDPVRVEVLASSRDEEAAMRAARREDADAAVSELAAAWTARGYRMTVSFVEECRGRPRGVVPWALAAECLALAEASFGVVFSRRTRALDEEHGRISSIPARRLHEHYDGPLAVVALAQRYVEVGPAATDDVDVSARLAQLQRRFTVPSG
jgi:predicted DNA-binding WGR domain protein